MARSFGEVIREMREAQTVGLREFAAKVGISPAYLSRIERGKERPPKPDVIKRIATRLGADPDVLFRLADSTDPDLADYLHLMPEAARFLRTAKNIGLEAEDFDQLTRELQERSQQQDDGVTAVD